MAKRDSRKTVLIVMHQAHSTPGRIGCYLTALGARLDIRRPSLDEPLPATLDDHDAVVVFGGPMSANDDCDWIAREIAWLETPLREDKPLLGICLGAQMLARTLGARGLHLSGPPRRDRLFPGAAARLAPTNYARRDFPAMSINGTATVSKCRRARNSSLRAARIFPPRRFATATRRSRSSSTRK